MTSNNSKTLFDHIDAILKYQNINYFRNRSTEDKKTWNLYMINRFISMEDDYVTTINMLDSLINNSSMSPENIYKLYISVFPKIIYRSKYIKAKDAQKYSDELINIIKTYYNVSKSEAIEYVDLYNSIENGLDELKSIIGKYGYTDKEINKILKG